MKMRDFSEWYNEIVERAELCDKRYAIKGMNVWLPYGLKLMNAIDALIRDEMERTGHAEVRFPLLIPKDQFAKEAEHIRGFDAEVYWVTHGGENRLDIPFLLRPTSETAMYPMFALWIRSHSDLPLKVFQIVNTFRYETKQTRAFIRVREIHFFEAHTCHADYEDAERQIVEDLHIVKRFARALCLPFLITRRPDWDKFAGAHYSIGIDTLMPSGRCLQIASIHQYKENFSRPYEIVYEDLDGRHRYVHQTTYGMSERVLGAIVGVHGDERGLKLPSKVSPFQVVIVPIITKETEDEVMNYCRKVLDTCLKAGIRAHLDARDLRPGNKFYHWELRGIPLRLEIGVREVREQKVVLACRDLPVGEGKKSLGLEGLADVLKMEMEDYDRRLYMSAEARLSSHIHFYEDYRDAEAEWIVKLGWCGSENCGHEMEDHLDMTMLGVLLDVDNREAEETSCSACGAPAHSVVLAKTY